MSDIKKIVDESFHRYAGSVIINRAICDARDMLKPSARMLMYSQKATTKNTPDKPFVKSARVVGDCLGHWYTHGDQACYSTYMRLAKPFAMRYPLEDCQGNCGTINAPGDEAASRYTEMRLSPLGNYLFSQIDKDTITEWENNFDDTEKYPRVLPSLGFYNIVNGTVGIGVSLMASCPQFNLREVNAALIKVLWDKDINFDEIYCCPDYATGGLLLNEEEVKESLRNGTGAAAKLRAVVEYDSTIRAFSIKELPYGVYTSTLTEQIKKLVEEDPNCGVETINDGSGKTPDYLIYISKKANPDKVLKFLFKNTSLQYHNTINLTMLKQGRFPKVYSWKELLIEHLEHEQIVYTRGFKFDLKKIESRLSIIDGLLKAISMLDEVIKTIKGSDTPKEANLALQKLLVINEIQAKAILDIKLSKLAHLEITKLKNEQSELLKEKERIEAILNDENLLKKEIEKGLREVAEKFGDARRTKVINISKDDEEPTEIKSLQISMTNHNNIYLSETSTLYTQKRGGVGNKAKLGAGEYVIHTEQLESNKEVAFFTAGGDFYHYPAAALAVGEKIAIEALFGIFNERIVAIAAFNKRRASQNIIFFTKNGFVKKSELAEYNLKRSGSLKAINLDTNDEIASILFINDEDVGIMTEMGNFIRITTKDIRPIGRVAKGIKGIKLNDGDAVCCAYPIKADSQYIVSVTASGLFKKTPIAEFTIQGKNTKGAKIHKLTDNDHMADFMALGAETEILVTSSQSCIKLSVNDIPTLSRVTQGAKAIKLNNIDKIIGISLY